MKALDKANTVELHHIVSDTYQNLSRATEAYINAQNEFTTLKREYEEIASVAHATGQITGKNEREREGNAILLNQELHQKMIDAEKAIQQTHLILALAKIEEQALVAALKVFSLALSE